MSNGKIRILLVDDDAFDRELVARLAPDEWELSMATTAEEAVKAARAKHPDCILIDFLLPDMDGLNLIDKLGGHDTAIIMLTGQGDERTAVEAMKRGAHDYLTKEGITAELLERSVRASLEKVKMLDTIRVQEKQKDKLIADLKEALDNIQTLRGLIPICATCKKVRDDQGYWQEVEQFVQKRSMAEFSHGICPDCSKDYVGGETAQ